MAKKKKRTVSQYLAEVDVNSPIEQRRFTPSQEGNSSPFGFSDVKASNVNEGSNVNSLISGGSSKKSDRKVSSYLSQIDVNAPVENRRFPTYQQQPPTTKVQPTGEEDGFGPWEWLKDKYNEAVSYLERENAKNGVVRREETPKTMEEDRAETLRNRQYAIDKAPDWLKNPLRKYSNALTRAGDSDIGKFVSRVGETGANTNLLSEEAPITTTGNKYADILADTLGSIMGLVTPTGGGASEVLGAGRTLAMGRSGLNFAENETAKALVGGASAGAMYGTAKGIANEKSVSDTMHEAFKEALNFALLDYGATKGPLKSALIGAGMFGGQSAYHGDSKEDILLNALTGGGMGLLGGLGHSRSVKNNLSQGILEPIEPMPEANAEAVKTGKIKTKNPVFYRDGKYKVYNDPYLQAVNNYNEAILEIQNRFGTNQLTENEFHLIKNELGIDLAKLVHDIEVTEKPILAQNFRDMIEHNRMGRVVGLLDNPQITGINSGQKYRPQTNPNLVQRPQTLRPQRPVQPIDFKASLVPPDPIPEEPQTIKVQNEVKPQEVKKPKKVEIPNYLEPVVTPEPSSKIKAHELIDTKGVKVGDKVTLKGLGEVTITNTERNGMIWFKKEGDQAERQMGKKAFGKNLEQIAKEQPTPIETPITEEAQPTKEAPKELPTATDNEFPSSADPYFRDKIKSIDTTKLMEEAENILEADTDKPIHALATFDTIKAELIRRDKAFKVEVGSKEWEALKKPLNLDNGNVVTLKGYGKLTVLSITDKGIMFYNPKDGSRINLSHVEANRLIEKKPEAVINGLLGDFHVRELLESIPKTTKGITKEIDYLKELLETAPEKRDKIYKSGLTSSTGPHYWDLTNPSEIDSVLKVYKVAKTQGYSNRSLDEMAKQFNTWQRINGLSEKELPKEAPKTDNSMSVKEEKPEVEEWDYLDTTHPDAMRLEWNRYQRSGSFRGGQNLSNEQKATWHKIQIERLNSALNSARSKDTKLGIQWANKNAQSMKTQEIKDLLAQRKMHETELKNYKARGIVPIGEKSPKPKKPKIDNSTPKVEPQPTKEVEKTTFEKAQEGVAKTKQEESQVRKLKRESGLKFDKFSRIFVIDQEKATVKFDRHSVEVDREYQKPWVVKRGTKVKVWTANNTSLEGEVVGIRSKDKKVIVNVREAKQPFPIDPAYLTPIEAERISHDPFRKEIKEVTYTPEEKEQFKKIQAEKEAKNPRPTLKEVALKEDLKNFREWSKNEFPDSQVKEDALYNEMARKREANEHIIVKDLVKEIEDKHKFTEEFIDEFNLKDYDSAVKWADNEPKLNWKDQFKFFAKDYFGEKEAPKTDKSVSVKEEPPTNEVEKDPLDNWLNTVSKDDVDFNKARDSHSWNSFDPERSARIVQEDYVKSMQNVYNQLKPLAKNPEQRALLVQELDRYKENYLKHVNIVLSAKSRTASPAVTGPARFPTARNEKALDVHHKRVSEFLEWEKKARNGIAKKLQGKMTAEEKTAEYLGTLKKDIAETVATLKGIESGTYHGSSTLFKSNLAGRLKRAVDNGRIEEVKQALEYLKEVEAKHLKKPVFSKNNAIWSYVDKVVKEKAEAPPPPTGEETIAEYDGVKIVKNHDAERVQIIFDEKPSKEVLQALKSSGWNYSPTNNAHQRKITTNAEYSAKNIVSKFFKEASKEEPQTIKVEPKVEPQPTNEVVKEAPKEPWQMTKAEFKEHIKNLEESKKNLRYSYEHAEVDKQIANLIGEANVPKTKSFTTQIGGKVHKRDLSESETLRAKNHLIELAHTKLVKKALDEGKSVPSEVLKETGITKTETKKSAKKSLIENWHDWLATRGIKNVSSDLEDFNRALEGNYGKGHEGNMYYLSARRSKYLESDTGVPYDPKTYYSLTKYDKDITLEGLKKQREHVIAKLRDGDVAPADLYNFFNGIDNMDRRIEQLESTKARDEEIRISNEKREKKEAEEKAKARQEEVKDIKKANTFHVRHPKGEFEAVKGKYVEVHPDIDTFVYKKQWSEKYHEFVVTEVKSGLKIASGNTQKLAIENAKNEIEHRGINDIKKLVENYVEDKGETPKPFKTVEEPKPKKPKAVAKHTFSKALGFQPEKAIHVEVHPEVEAFAYKEAGGYVITEAKSGVALGRDKTLQKAIETVQALIEKHGIERLNQEIKKHTDANGVSPSYKPKEDTKAFVGKANQLKLNQGEGGKETISRGSIVDYLKQELDIPIRAGRIRQKRALGIFKVQPEVIRSLKSLDIPTIAHEVGHFISKKVPKLTETKFYPELIKLGNKTSAKDYTVEQRVEEGIAEFTRLYMTDVAEAKKQAPNFYDHFENHIGEETKKVLWEARKGVDTWKNQSSLDRAKESISNEKREEPKSVKKTLEKLYTTWVDELHPLEKFTELLNGMGLPVDENPYLRAWASRGWVGKAQTWLHKGQFDSNFNKIGKSLQEILKPVEKNLEDFKAYIYAKRTVELWERTKKEKYKVKEVALDEDGEPITLKNGKPKMVEVIKEREVPNPIKSGLDYKDALNIVKQFENNAEFKQAQKELVEYSQNLNRLAVKEGFLSQELVDYLEKEHQNYIPLYRVFEESGDGFVVKQHSYANLPQYIKAIKGSDKEIIDPIESLVKNTFTLVNLVERNAPAKLLVQLARKNEGMGKFVEEVPSGKHNSLDNVITVYENGKPSHYQVHPELKTALLSLDAEHSSALVRILSVPAKALRLGATLNPDFLVKNPVRDQFSAGIYSKYGFVPVVDFFRGLSHIAKNSDVYFKFNASGTSGANFVSLDRNYLRGSLKKILKKAYAEKEKYNIIDNPKDLFKLIKKYGEIGYEGLAQVSEVMEEATRVGEFAKGLKKEGTSRRGIMTSSLAGRDITIDFSRRGTAGKNVNRTNAFFNATIQGMDKFARAFKSDPVGMTIRLAKFVVLPSVITYMMNRNNPYYEDAEDWEKDLFWLIPLNKKGDFLRIPKPFEAGVMFGSGIERAMQFFDKEDPKAFDGYGKSLLNGAVPSVIPTALVPWIEHQTNHSFFTGRDVVPEREAKNLTPEKQYGPNTSEISKGLGSVFNISPRYVDNYIRGYTGGLGANYGVPVADFVYTTLFGSDKAPPVGKSLPKNLPIVKGFVSESTDGSSKSMDLFYKDLDNQERAYKTWKADNNITEPQVPEPLQRARKLSDTMSDVRGSIRAIQQTKELNSSQKKEIIEELNYINLNLARVGAGKKPYDEGRLAELLGKYRIGE